MNTPRILSTIAIVAIGLLVWVSAAGAKDKMCIPMGEITLKSPAEKASRPAVSFPHAVHMRYDCQRCHHTWTGRELITGCSVSGCHDLKSLDNTKDNKSLAIRYFKNAYHQQCIGCHKEIAVKNQKAEASIMGGHKVAPNGPTGCKDCHS
jgi:hypothetical protein